MMAFSMFCGLDLVRANGSAKLVNLASNVGALTSFFTGSNVLIALAIPAALCNMAGAYFGSHLAVKKGAKIIRPMFFIVLTLLLGTVVYRFFA